LANQAKLQSFHTRPIYKFGVQVPRNHQEEIELDMNIRNSKWKDAEATELSRIDNYETFIDFGKKGRPLPDYKRNLVHMVYEVKHDGRHLLADTSLRPPLTVCTQV